MMRVSVIRPRSRFHYSLVARLPAPQLSNPNEEDSIQTILNTIGVKYSHLNDEILLPSRIEEERTRKSLMASVRLPIIPFDS